MQPGSLLIHAQMVESAEKTKDIVELRLKGWSYAQIAEKYGCTKQAIHQRFKAAIKDIPEEALNEARSLEMQRLDALLIEAHKLTVSEDPETAAKGIELERKISADRRKFLGLDAPTRTELSGPDGKPLQLVDVTRLSDEELARLTGAPAGPALAPASDGGTGETEESSEEDGVPV